MFATYSVLEFCGHRDGLEPSRCWKLLEAGRRSSTSPSSAAEQVGDLLNGLLPLAVESLGERGLVAVSIGCRPLPELRACAEASPSFVVAVEHVAIAYGAALTAQDTPVTFVVKAAMPLLR